MIKIKIKSVPLKEGDESNKRNHTFVVETTPEIFLRLAKKDENLQRRSDIVVGDFDQSKAGTIFLGIDPKSGRVIEHSGRARSLAASKKMNTYNIFIKTTEEVTWDEIASKIVSEDGTEIFSKDKIFKLISATTQEEEKLYKLVINGKLLTLSHNLQNLKRIKHTLNSRDIAKIKPNKSINSTDIKDYDILNNQEKQELIDSL